MERPTVRILVVDDYERWRTFSAATLRKKLELAVISEASDGLEAVQQTQELRPDLILLDIGLPMLNGIEAARRIRQHAPETKILFVSGERSSDIVEEALRTGASGYVFKSEAATELLPAVEAILQGKRFVSASLTGSRFADPGMPKVGTPGQHMACFYSDDRQLLDELTEFIGSALEAGNAAIAVATGSHLNGLLPRLQARGIDIAAAIKQGRYIAVDAMASIAAFMVGDVLDPVRFMEECANLVAAARKAATGKRPRVAVFGEGVQLLWAQGNSEAAIQDEKLCNELTKRYDVDILCAYPAANTEARMDTEIFQRICAEHSAVYSV